MKKQITRLSPHQNAKVCAVLFAILTLPFMLIGLLMLNFMPTPPTPEGRAAVHFPVFFFILAPVIYAVMGYIMTAIGCLIYNLVVKLTGGLEFVVQENPGV